MGLVELRPNRGAVVLPFNPDSLRGIYHVRMALESEAARLAARHILPEEAEACESAFRTLLESGVRDLAWSARASTLDQQFHEMVGTWAGVARLAIEIRRHGQLAQLLEQDIREAQGYRHSEQEHTIRQHLAILGALRRGDADLAANAMREHLLYAAELAVAALFFSRQTA
jgi:DNA-binding GntR family transcriptional regulator